MVDQADTYFRQGTPQKTVELAQQALVIFQEIKEPRLQAFAYRELSVGYGELGNDAQAMAEAQNFLTFARKTKNSLWEKNALNLIGDLHKKFGRKQQAIIAYQQALFITTDNQVTGNNAGTYAGLANIYQSLNQPNTAITYYKQYINKIEEVRHGIQGLPPELQNSFLNTTVDFNKVKIADIYRQYANLLLSQGRQQEATQVLELLKIQEIQEVSTGGNTTSNMPKLPLTSSEMKIAAPNPSIIALGIQIRECEQKNCPQQTQLHDKLTAVVDEFNQELEKIDKEISSRIAIDKSTFDPTKLAAVREIVKQPGTVMIYPLVLDDKLWLLLYSGDAAQKFEVSVTRAELGKTVKEFRDLMEECEKRVCGSVDIAKVQPVSHKLYDWLIKPIETELKKNQVKNIVFALDRVTRYVPMSALFDGKQYLIENYTTYNVLSADLTDVHDKLSKGTQNNPVLAMGISNAVGGFRALPNVPKELDAIVKHNTSNQGIYPGKEYLNSAFNYRSLRDNLTGHKILHLATHGAFVAGSKDESYLLLGTGDKLRIREIKNLTGLSNIHLVVLSACQTALAAPLQDGVEIASVAYYFLNDGAKAVMASLWQVSDASTSELMQHFQDLRIDKLDNKCSSEKKKKYAIASPQDNGDGCSHIRRKLADLFIIKMPKSQGRCGTLY
ncbi:MAG: CHAT domain-containing protein [Rhizonema sp. PD38]|nr:CHAT domain-containing protein [Rhizonema sp. PD38]